MKVIKQAWRGCGNLPYVGEHPGLEFAVIFVLIGVLAGARQGIWGAIFGGAFMSAFVGPLFLYGAYERAVLSDRLTEAAAKD